MLYWKRSLTEVHRGALFQMRTLKVLPRRAHSGRGWLIFAGKSDSLVAFVLLANINSEWVTTSIEQWDIYKLDPAYHCVLYPAYPMISRKPHPVPFVEVETGGIDLLQVSEHGG